MRLRDIFRRRRNGKSGYVDSPAGKDPIGIATIETYTPRLPDDIIYELFEAAALVYPPRALVTTPASAQALAPANTLLGWVILTHVCRRWRSIGLSATLAPLWARVVCLSRKPSVAFELISRARGHPLTVELMRLEDNIRLEYADLVQLENWALQIIPKADVLIDPGRIILEKLNRHKLVLPTLCELHVGRQLVLPMEWEAPGLRRATLDMVLLPSHMAGGLRELTLRIDADRMRLTRLRDFLHHCALLEDLDLTVESEWSEHEYRYDAQLRFDHLKCARIVVRTDTAAVDVWQLIVGPPHLSSILILASDKPTHVPLPRPRVLLDTYAGIMDSSLYDKMEMGMSEIRTGRRDLYLRLSSSSSSVSCELLFPTDETTRATVLSLLPSYIPVAAARIQSIALGGFIANTIHIDRESFRALGRALTRVEHFELEGMDFWSVAVHVRMLRQTRRAPVFPALSTIQISNAHLPEERDGLWPGIIRAQQWWDTIASALATRKEAGLASVDSLRFDGVWTGKYSWNEGEGQEIWEKVKTKRLVGELVDERVWDV